MLTIYKAVGKELEYLLPDWKTPEVERGWALNLYRGCSHGCRNKYCYNFRTGRYYCTSNPNDREPSSTLENIERDLRQLAAEGNRDYIHMSFKGDIFDCGRIDNKHTRDVLKLSREYDHPFQTLSKGGMCALFDIDLFGQEDRFGMTLTFDNPTDSEMWEAGTALPEDRIKALKMAHDEFGILTWVSLEPVIIPEQSLHLIDLTHEFVDFYGVGKLNHHPEIEKRVDYRKFRAEAVAKLEGYDKQYKIKKTLRWA
jgi:DNA repair photolyase